MITQKCELAFIIYISQYVSCMIRFIPLQDVQYTSVKL